MSRRMSKKLRLLLEENDLKSPDILTAIITVNNVNDAYSLVGVYMQVTKTEFPFENLNADSWCRNLKLPAELYFKFKRKKELVSFVRLTRKEFPNMPIIL